MKHQEFFWVEPEDVFSNHLILRGTEQKHLIQVLRKKIGDWASATDGQGHVYDFFITEIEKNQVKGQIQKKRRRVGEPFFRVTLAQALLKGDHFEWVLEKGTEIGVTQFIPFSSEYSVAADVTPTRLNRYRRIVREALKQCGRSVVPAVNEPVPFSELLTMAPNYQLKLLAHPDKGALAMRFLLDSRIKNRPPSSFRNGLVLIGPEGGFSLEEIQQARAQGFDLVTLGKRRLRAETAALVCTTILMEKMGEL